MLVNSYHYLLGPLVAVAAMGVLVLICRWVFSTSDRDERTARRLEKVRGSGEFGLLVPVATARTEEDVALLRQVLRDAGVRVTTAPAADGIVVLVFRADADRARHLVHT